MASSPNCVSQGNNEEHEQHGQLTSQQNIYSQHLQDLRRQRAIPSNQGLVTAFAILCSIVVLLTYVETSRMLIPTKVVSKHDLRSLTSGFTNDLTNKHSKDVAAWTAQRRLHRHRPKALFIGFSHCGGEGIVSALGAHPGIRVNKNDLRYFTGNVSLRRYLSHMPPSLDHHMTTDVCWSCITNWSALHKIRSFNKTIKLVVVVCDPILRLLANHTASSGHHTKNVWSFLNIIDQTNYDLESLKSKISVVFSLLNNLNPQLLTENGDYLRYLADLFDTFPRKHVLIVDTHTFRRNFVSELSRIHTFLGVEPYKNLHGIKYEPDRDMMCYNFTYGVRTCIQDKADNLTELFSTDLSFLKSLKQFYMPFNRRLFVYLENKYNWTQ